MALLLLILTIILNCATQPCNIPVFETANILTELTEIVQCQVLDISITSKIILSFLTPILTNEQCLCLSLAPDEAEYLVTTLSKAVLSPDLREDGHSVKELLHFLINFTTRLGADIENIGSGQQKQKYSNFHAQYKRQKDVSTKNTEMLINLGLVDSLEKLVVLETIDSPVMEEALQLIWNLVHEEAALPVISSAVSKILSTPHVEAGANTLMQCIQWLLGGADKSGNLTSLM